MKLLLTSAGINNPSIRRALDELLGKPVAESTALCIPTGVYPHPDGASGAYEFIHGSAASPMSGLGWKSLGVLELTALPSIEKDHWVAAVQATDALLVWGGNTFYLCYWMRKSGLADLLPSLRETVYVGVSAGSMVVTPDFGESYDGRNPPVGSDDGLGLVDFSLAPHLDHAASRVTPWPTCSSGPPGYLRLRMQSTMRPPSKWPTVPSKSSPRGTGSCSPRRTGSPAKRWTTRREATRRWSCRLGVRRTSASSG